MQDWIFSVSLNTSNVVSLLRPTLAAFEASCCTDPLGLHLKGAPTEEEKAQAEEAEAEEAEAAEGEEAAGAL